MVPVSVNKRLITGLLVAAVAVVLATFDPVADPRLQLASANRAAARVDLSALSAALDRFADVHGDLYPERLFELLAQDEGGDNYLPGYDKAPPMDPWGHPYVYIPTEDRQACSVASCGSDGALGGDGEARDLSVELRRAVR